jgi:hypothetical protein
VRSAAATVNPRYRVLHATTTCPALHGLSIAKCARIAVTKHTPACPYIPAGYVKCALILRQACTGPVRMRRSAHATCRPAPRRLDLRARYRCRCRPRFARWDRRAIATSSTDLGYVWYRWHIATAVGARAAHECARGRRGEGANARRGEGTCACIDGRIIESVGRGLRMRRGSLLRTCARTSLCCRTNFGLS